jgi:carbonic anhydrase
MSFITKLNTSVVLTRIYSQVHPDDDSVLSVITFAIGPLGVEHGTALRPPSALSHNTLAEPIVRYNTVLVVGHTNCGGAAATLKAVIDGAPPPPQPLARWLEPLTALVGTLGLANVPESERMTKIVEASVRAQVENVVNSQPVQAAWAGGRKNLWVHGLVYELEAGILKDLNVTRGPPT